MTLIRMMNEPFNHVSYYIKYCIIKTPPQYDDYVAKEFDKIANKTAVRIKNYKFNGKNSSLLLSATNVFSESRCIQHLLGQAMLLFKYYLS